MPRNMRTAVFIVAALGLVLAACSSKEPAAQEGPPTTAASSGSPSISPGASPTGFPVGVTLQEYAVLPAVATAPGGQISFTARNVGPMMEHELVVVRTDLAPDQLPTSADGSVDEEGTGIEAIGEIGEFPVGQTRGVTLMLTPGKYVLFCNVVHAEGSETHVHYKLGMRTAFTVT